MSPPTTRHDAVTRACADAGLDASYAGIVESLMDQPDDAWRTCCGSSCTPCALTLAAAVDRAREILAPRDLPAAPPPSGE